MQGFFLHKANEKYKQKSLNIIEKNSKTVQKFWEVCENAA